MAITQRNLVFAHVPSMRPIEDLVANGEVERPKCDPLRYISLCLASYTQRFPDLEYPDDSQRLIRAGWNCGPNGRYKFEPKARRRPSQSLTTNSRERHGMSASSRVNSTPLDAYSA
jgi:hypothetical protein